MTSPAHLVSEEDLGVVGDGFNKLELEKLGRQLQPVSLGFSHHPVQGGLNFVMRTIRIGVCSRKNSTLEGSSDPPSTPDYHLQKQFINMYTRGLNIRPINSKKKVFWPRICLEISYVGRPMLNQLCSGQNDNVEWGQ